MTGDQYRIRAAELQAKAANEQNEILAAEWNNLARRLSQTRRTRRQEYLGFHPKLDSEGEGT
jgi:hypothetical protein